MQKVSAHPLYSSEIVPEADEAAGTLSMEPGQKNIGTWKKMEEKNITLVEGGRMDPPWFFINYSWKKYRIATTHLVSSC